MKRPAQKQNVRIPTRLSFELLEDRNAPGLITNPLLDYSFQLPPDPFCCVREANSNAIRVSGVSHKLATNLMQMQKVSKDSIRNETVAVSGTGSISNRTQSKAHERDTGDNLNLFPNSVSNYTRNQLISGMHGSGVFNNIPDIQYAGMLTRDQHGFTSTFDSIVGAAFSMGSSAINPIGDSVIGSASEMGPPGPPSPPPPPPGGGGGTELVASNDIYSVLHDTILNANSFDHPLLIANDNLGNRATTGVIVVDQPLHGSLRSQGLEIGVIGDFQYCPDSLYVGADTFTYYLTDGVYTSNLATVSISVTDVAPVATNDSFTTYEDVPLTIAPVGAYTELTVNDYDSDNEPFSVRIVQLPNHGTINLDTDGSFTYTPEINYHGPDSFTYSITDGPMTSAPATASISIITNNEFRGDIDGHDGATVGAWMRESEEGTYGLQASVELHHQAILWETNFVSVASRELLWDGNTLSVNGSTSGYMQVASHGDILLDIAAVRVGYGTSAISYSATGTTVSGMGGGFAILFKVAEKKCIVQSIKFETDHKLLFDETVLTNRLGQRYNVPQYDADSNYSAAMTMTKNTHTKVKVKLRWSGINAADLTGTGSMMNAPTDAFSYAANIAFNAMEGKNFETALLTSIDKLPDVISGKHDVMINWEWDNKTRPSGSSVNELFVTYDEPSNPNAAAHLIPTYKRMSLSVSAFTQGYADAKNQKDPPSPIRVLYCAMKRKQVFDLSTNVTSRANGHNSASIWQVPSLWSVSRVVPIFMPYVFVIRAGVDCLSNCMFFMYASSLVGLPETISVVTVIPDVFANPIVYTKADNGDLGETRYQLIDRTGGRNNYEACIKYNITLNGNIHTKYITGGTTFAFKEMDDVLTQMFASVVEYPAGVAKNDLDKAVTRYTYGAQPNEDLNFGD